MEKEACTSIIMAKCDDLTGRHLGRGGLTNPPQKEQCGKTVHTAQAYWARGAKTRNPYN